MGLIEDWFGQDDEEFWNGIPVIGDARRAVIDIPDSTWNDIPVVGPARETVLKLESVTKIPSWAWLVAGGLLVGLVIWKVVK